MALRKKTGKPKPKRKTRSKDKPTRETPKRDDTKKHNGKGGEPWHRRTKSRVKPKLPPKQRPGVRARR